jgi:hypothetical protein
MTEEEWIRERCGGEYIQKNRDYARLGMLPR